MRQVLNLNEDWRFIRGDFAPRSHAEGWDGAKGKSFYFGMTASNIDESKWQVVTLPHDYGIETDYSTRNESFIGADRVPDMSSINSRLFAAGSLPGCVAWYRRKFSLPKEARDKRVRIVFDGVYRNSTVYLNEHFIGSHESGYTSFSFDISDFVYTDKQNTLCVRVDSTEHEGWWYEGGGIYRGVRLEITEKLSIAEHGVYVTAEPDLSQTRNEALIMCAPSKVRIETVLQSRLDDESENRIVNAVLNEQDKDSSFPIDKKLVSEEKSIRKIL